jgi:mannosyl-glycoprotein endo-beta-N-acetylglucosaminidase
VCHDIPKGLVEDVLENDFTKSFAYRHNFWANIDVFIYFSHNRLTIPPMGWTNIAHEFGVKMLGTLCFEWDEGEKETVLMLDG